MIESLKTPQERCILVGLASAKKERWQVEDHLEELNSLAGTAGAEVISTVLQERLAPDPAYFIGKGKVEEIAFFIEENDIHLVIFDDELSPAQVRNLERLLNRKIIDRTALILDIFADHAKTNAAKTQVELAQLNYLLPRLTRQWQHLSRQVGGIGTKGPGETQLETDRRLVRTRIAHLRERLERIKQQNITQRQNRKHSFRASLIGYTNAGKSTIMNALSGADILVEDKLFATLDTTVRRVDLNSEQNMLLSDTVGFIRKLPHHLIASFQTTLSEVVEADLLIHVVDITYSNLEENMRVVNQILKDMNLSHKPRLILFNKVDKLRNEGLIRQLSITYPDALFISARRRIGLKAVRQKLTEYMESSYETRDIRIHCSDGNAEYLIRSLAKVIRKESDEEYLYYTVKFPKENRSRLSAVLEQFQESI